MVFAIGCSSSAPSAPSCPPPSGKLVVTADWLNRSLTLFDYARVTSAACSDEDAKTGAIDLSAYAPGPIELALTPDGTRAVVSIGQGSVAFTITQQPIPPGGGVLVVDLATKSVLHEVKTPAAPEGVAVDSRNAYSANFGDDSAAGDTMSQIDIDEGKDIADAKLAGRPKQIAVSDRLHYGLVSLADIGGVRLFDTGSLQNSLTAVFKTAADPSGAAILDAICIDTCGTAIVANALALSYSVLEPAPELGKAHVVSTQQLSAAPYGVTLIPGTNKVAITTILASTALVIVDASTSPPTAADPIGLEGGAFPLGVAIDAQGAFAFVAHARDHALSVVDLNARQLVITRHLDWLAEPGPTYVAVQP